MEWVPRHISPPDDVELKPSRVNRSRIGAFCLRSIPKDSVFGPYSGKIVFDQYDPDVDPKYSWEVFDLDTFKFLHIVDATNPIDGNWMRYVCCARFFEEQNIVSTQNGQEVFYKALKDIEPGHELLTWFQPKKKKRKKSSTYQPAKTPIQARSKAVSNGYDANESSDTGGKRKRKPKIIPDSYEGPLEYEVKKLKPGVNDDMFEPLQPGQKRRRRKKISVDSRTSSTTSLDLEASDKTAASDDIKTETGELPEASIDEDSRADSIASASTTVSGTDKVSREGKKENGAAMSISEINNTVDWVFPPRGQEYYFELKKHHIEVMFGKKMYKCDICLGLYKHMFSLKRHYLRNHVNYKYLSKADMTNCLINLAQVIQNMRDRGLKTNSSVDRKNVLTAHENHGQLEHSDAQAINDSTDTTQDEYDKKLDAYSEQDIIGKDESVPEDRTSKDISGIVTSDKDKFTDEGTNSKDVDNNEKDNSLKNNTDVNSDVSEAKNEEDNIKQQKDDNNKMDSEADDNLEHIKPCERDNNVESETISDKMPPDQTILNCNNDSIDSTVSSFNENIDKSSSDSILSENNMETENSVESSEALEDGKKRKDMPGLFRCYTCYDVFDSVESVREHVQNHPKQEEGTCFSCDKCNMRFNYKQNLVRHQQVHAIEGGPHSNKVDEDEALLPGSENDTVTSTDREPARLGFGSPPIQSSMYQVFKCSKCKTKFESLEAMTDHVQAEHITGSQYQCQYCGKEFPSMPNMKKHVRFHLGYRVSCRLCTDVFPNVGALRKHTRIAHTEAYKAKQLEKLENIGTNQKTEGKVKTETSTNNNKLLKSVTSLKPPIITGNTNIEKQEDSFALDHDISFAADEIDDGGSRFKFSCTVCKKRFSNYINMCRHRRKSHSNDSKPRHEELSLNFNRNNRSRNLSPVTEDPEEVARFYANVSHNIAINLNCYIDGHQEALEKFVDHIKIDNYSGNLGFDQSQPESHNLTWENYNFPPDFKPITIVPVPEPRVPEVDIDSVTPETSADHTQCDKTVSDEVTDNTVIEFEDSAVIDNNSEHSDGESEALEMGTMSGLKNLAAVAAAISEKKQNNKIELGGANTFVKIKIAGGMIHRGLVENKTLSQVENGEYANFEDDLSPSDISCTQRPESKAKAKFQQYKESEKKKALGYSSESIVSMKSTGRISPTNHELYSGAAQAELSCLYDNIDSPDSPDSGTGSENMTTLKTFTPQLLSVLCENVLGLKSRSAYKKDEKQDIVDMDESEDFQNESALLSELSLASQRTARMKMTNGARKVVPDYSDVPQGSPFYNYDSIAFGRNGEVVSVCAICRKQFKDIEGVLRHHWKKHAGSVFQILEVEQGHQIDSLHFTQPSYVGALAVTDPGLDSLNDMETFTCTKCGGLFRSIPKLHVHIVNCSPIDPVNGFSKTDKCPSKTSLTKKIQQKFNNLLATDQLAKAKMFAMRNGLPYEPKSRKRMFTGCRKRKSVLLPDSPIKTALLTAHLSDLRTGYNPNRHIRRRELTELVDTLTCEACGLKFKTIILLERHVKNCSKKEKFKNVQPLACPIMDESLARIKNICFYCEKNFTYTKSLINHFQDFCPIKKAKMDRGDLSANDKLREDEIVDRLKRIEDEKLARDTEHVKKKITWQVGRKPKRKGHSWTCVKKRKQGLQAESLDTEDGAGDEENLEETELTDNELANEESEESPDTSGALDASDENVLDTVPDEKNLACSGYDEVDSVSETGLEFRLSSASVPEVENNLDSNPELEKKLRESEGNIAKDYILPPLEELHETSINDTSLNCTARYQVNQIVTHKQKKNFDASVKSTSTAVKSSFIFQCVSNEQEAKGNEYEPLVQRRIKESSSLIIESKRKRERVSKVEEFLRNAFRRKRRGKKTDKSEEMLDAAKDENDSQAGDMAPEYDNSNLTENSDTIKDSIDNNYIEAKLEDNLNSVTDSGFSGQNCDKLLDSVLSDRDGPRKRGRPRKIGTDLQVNNNIGVPRKRGRPRKPHVSPAISHKSFMSQRGKGVGRPPHCYVPGQRGRPPKWKRLLWSLQRDGKLKHGDVTDSVNNTDDKPLIDSVSEYNNAETEVIEDVDNQLIEDHEDTDMQEGGYMDSDVEENDKEVEIKKDEIEDHSDCIDSVDTPLDNCDKIENNNAVDSTSDQSRKVEIGDSQQDLCKDIESDDFVESQMDQCKTVESANRHFQHFCTESETLKISEEISASTTAMNVNKIEDSQDTDAVEENDLTNSHTCTNIGETAGVEEDLPLITETEATLENQHGESLLTGNSGTLSVPEQQTDKAPNTETTSTADNKTIGPIRYADEVSIADHHVIESVTNSTLETVKESKVEEKSAVVSIVDSSNETVLPGEVKKETDTARIDILDFKPEKEVCEQNDMCYGKLNTISNSNDATNSQDCDNQNADHDCEVLEVCPTIKSKDKSVEIDINKTSTSSTENDTNDISISVSSKVENEVDNNSKMTLPKSPEPSPRDWYPMVLSPSERVKMNKRSCTSREPNTPVWVRKPTKPKVKPSVSDSKIVDSSHRKVVSRSDSDTIKKETHKPSQETDKIVPSDMLKNKKPLFKKRVEAINENLKLLDKRVNSGYLSAAKADSEGESTLREYSKEARQSHISQLGTNKGVKRKQIDDYETESSVPDKQAKRILVAEKIRKLSDQANNDTKLSQINSKGDSKGKLLTKDKKTSKVKVGKR